MTAPVEITLLTQNACAFCDHAKHVLQRVGQDHPLRITEVNLTSEEGQQLARKAGVLFAPGLLIDGEPFSFGRLSERKLRRALGKRPSKE
ncbi:MAG: thioredoxin family protein [Actinophytocola sp.]|nr:thioredoxin family protein [Actinophytocola sp.]